MGLQHPAQRIAISLVAAITFAGASAGARENNSSSLSSQVLAPSNAFELAIGTGYTQGFGRIAHTRTLPDVAGPGLGGSLELDYRMSPLWSVGLETGYHALSSEESAWVRGLTANFGGTYHFRPNQVGDPFLRLGTGYRFLWEHNPDGTTNNTVLHHGVELLSGKVGYDLRATDSLALAPVLGIDLDMFFSERATGTPGVVAKTGEIGTFIYVCLQGRFDFGGKRMIAKAR